MDILAIHKDNPLLGSLPPYTFESIAVITTLSLICGFYSYKFNYWKRQGVNGPIPMNPLGDLVNDFKNGLRLNDFMNVKKYGKVFGIYTATRPVLVVTDPELIKEIAVTHFVQLSGSNFRLGHHVMKNMSLATSGAEWKRKRSIISPTFTSGKMKAMMPMIEDSYEVLDEVIQETINGDSNGVVEIKTLFANFTMEVIGKCAFATDMDCQKNESEFQYHARSFFNVSFIKFFLAIALPKFIVEKLQLVPQRLEHLDYLLGLCREVIRKRKEEGSMAKLRNYTDFLALMLDTEEVLTENEVLASSLVILIAGYETTATLMTYMSYALARHPEIQEKLLKEVDAVEKVDYESIFKLEYLDAVLHETLRMYPPFLRLERKALENVTLSNGIIIEKDTAIRVPIYSVHHDPELFPEPEVFKPERFLPENKESLVPYSWIPFFDGPRNCVGRRFAEMEAKLCMTRLLRKYKFSVCPKTEGELKFRKVAFILQAESVTVQLVERS